MLIWSLLFVVVTSGMVISHAVFIAASRRSQETRSQHEAITSTIARSGLGDALGWFRRQEAQPVQAFDPKLEPAGDPPIFDTLDPSVGLVREFLIRGDLWGRYEVRHQEVADISEARGSSQKGSAWDLSVRAFVFRRAGTEDFDESSTPIVARTRMSTEMRTLRFQPPAPAAVHVMDPAAVRLMYNAVIDGGGNAGVAFPMSTAETIAVPGDDLLDLDADVGSLLEGEPAKIAILDYELSSDALFEMPKLDLRAFSDRVTQTPRQLASARLDNDVVYHSGDLTLAAGNAITGRLLLYVDGDLVVDADNGSQLAGIVYVGGDTVIEGPFALDGTLIGGGSVTLGGGNGQVEITYDSDAIDGLKQALSLYRLRRSVRPTN